MKSKLIDIDKCPKCGKKFCTRCGELHANPTPRKRRLWCAVCNEKHIKYRECLRCGEKFLSFGYANRLCMPCSLFNKSVGGGTDDLKKFDTLDWEEINLDKS